MPCKSHDNTIILRNNSETFKFQSETLISNCCNSIVLCKKKKYSLQISIANCFHRSLYPRSRDNQVNGVALASECAAIYTLPEHHDDALDCRHTRSSRIL